MPKKRILVRKIGSVKAISAPNRKMKIAMEIMVFPKNVSLTFVNNLLTCFTVILISLF
jgi:hypothetical protein